MLPSQIGWPFLTGNGEEPAGQTCETAPVAQVKILRRPRPHDHNQQSQSTSGATGQRGTCSGLTAGKCVELGHKSDQALHKSTPSSYYANDDEWPSIADAESKNLGSQKQKYNVLKKSSDNNIVSNGEMNQAMTHETLVSSIMSKPASSVAHNAQIDTPELCRPPKAPIKTYKERADEYAKARLRILGSAFSDDDDKVNTGAIANIHKSSTNG